MPNRSSLAAILFLWSGCRGDAGSGCHPRDPAAAGPDCFERTFYTDADYDGYGDPEAEQAACETRPGLVDNADDCDDTDASVAPGEHESCNDRDDDCDGVPDDGVRLSTWYADADGDTFGDPAVSTEACDRPEDFVMTGTDCDDADPDVNPGELERCGGGDEDCDGEVDESSAVGATRWYLDADGDGYGDATNAIVTCESLAGYLEDGTDCDDGSRYVYPGAYEWDCSDPTDYNCDGSGGLTDSDGDGWPACEDCDDGEPDVSPVGTEVCGGVDENCDGETDDGAADAPAWYRDADGDGLGDPENAYLSCTLPVGYVADAGDCDDSDAAIGGCSYWYADLDADGYGGASACLCEATEPYTSVIDGDCDDAAAAVNPDATEVCGSGVDDDCDGVATGCGLAGEIDAATATKVTGLVAGDFFGNAVASVGDVDGDGLADLAVAGYGADAVWLLPGPLDAAAGSAAFSSATSGDEAGRAIASVPADGDVERDLVIGAHESDDGETNGGMVYVVRAPLLTAPPSLSDVDIALWGERNEKAGFTLAAGGDAAGDGAEDLYVGAHAADRGTGKVYAFDAIPGVAGGLADEADATLTGESAVDYFGKSVVVVGDADGDGLDEIAVGAYGVDERGSNSGAVYVFTGPLVGTLTPADAIATRYGPTDGDQAGSSIGAGGDVDGDGYVDFIVGVFTSETVYLVRGPATGVADLGGDGILLGEGSGDGTGIGLTIAPCDDDAYADVVVSGNGVTHGYTGVVWVAYGPISGTVSLADAEATVTGTGGYSNQLTQFLATEDLDGDDYVDLVIGASYDSDAGSRAGAVFLIPGGEGL